MSQGEYFVQVEQAQRRQEEEAQAESDLLKEHKKWVTNFWRNTPNGFGLTRPKRYDNETNEETQETTK